MHWKYIKCNQRVSFVGPSCTCTIHFVALECHGVVKGNGLGTCFLITFFSKMSWCQPQHPPKDQRKSVGLSLVAFDSSGGFGKSSDLVTDLVTFCNTASGCDDAFVWLAEKKTSIWLARTIPGWKKCICESICIRGVSKASRINAVEFPNDKQCHSTHVCFANAFKMYVSVGFC